MKRTQLVILVVAVFTSFFNQAQDLTKVNKWSVGLQVGGVDATRPNNSTTKFFTHINGDVRYMVNNRFGVMGDLAYNNIGWKTADINNTQLTRISLQGVLNMRDIMRFDTWTNRFGLLFHGGAGLSNMWQEGMFTFGKGDLMGNFIVGLTPQFKINDRVAVNVDWSWIVNSRQDRTFDFTEKNDRSGVNGFYMTASAGVSIALGKKDRHADWVATEFGGGKDTELAKRVAQLEGQLRDDDNDGVPNMKDIQANTPAGSVVNTKGEAVVASTDSDNDGITDAYDECPNVKGLFSTNGCPDADRDGVIDSKDKCPNTPGLVSEGGCPKVDAETKKVFDEALHGINFETGKDVIKSSSFPILQKVVEVMEKNPEFKLEIAGHTDNTGDEAKNMELSKARAKAVKDYLNTKGIDAARMTSNGFGQTKPTSTNDTPEGRADNRRVEFTVIF